MNRVKELCIRNDIQQKELAIMAGVSQPTVSDWVNQKKDPSGERLEKLSEIFGVSRAVILGYDDLIGRKTNSADTADELSEYTALFDRLDDESKRIVMDLINKLSERK